MSQARMRANRLRFPHHAIAVLVSAISLLLLGSVLAQPQHGGTLMAGVNGDCLQLDPHLTGEITCRTIVGRHIFNGLLTFDAEMRPIADLAESWETSADGLTWIFHLREGVMFHNGEEFTAEDAEFSLERILNPDLGSPYRSSFASVSDVEVVGSHTLQVHLSAPDATILANLAAPQIAILPRSLYQDQDPSSSSLIGTGPFMLDERQQDIQTTLVRNPNYWNDDLPYLDGIEFRVIGDDTARSAALRTGEVDFMDRLTLGTLEVLERDEDVVIVGGSSLNHRVVVPNLDREPWDDIRVRQAFAMGIDRSEIVEAVLGGRGEPLIGGPIPSNILGTLEEPCYPEPDVEGAMALLAEAGYPDGFSSTLLSFGQITILTNTAIALREQARKLGIDLELELLETGVVQARAAERDYDLVVRGYAGGVDPDGWLRDPFHSESQRNYNSFGDPEIDRLIDAGRSTFEPEERNQIYQELQQRLCEVVPLFSIYNASAFFAHQPYVEGYVFRANNEHNFAEVWLNR